MLAGIVTGVVGKAVLGQQPDGREILAGVRKRWFGLLIVSVLAEVLPWTPFLLILVGVLLTAVSTALGVTIAVVGGLAALVIGPLLWGRLAVAVPIFVLERLGPAASVARSWRLVHGAFWRTFGFAGAGVDHRVGRRQRAVATAHRRRVRLRDPRQAAVDPRAGDGRDSQRDRVDAHSAARRRIVDVDLHGPSNARRGPRHPTHPGRPGSRLRRGAAAVTALTWIVAGSPPDPVTRDGAAAAARSEVAKRAYHRGDPSLVDRALIWVFKRVLKALGASARHAPGHAIGFVLVAVVLAALIVLVFVRVGVLRRSPRVDDAIFGIEQTTADDHRRRAEQFAAQGEWAEAIRERLRAVAREFEQRGVLDPRPGRTAAELSREAGAQLPALAADLRAATATFDAVWYGGRTATAADEAQLRALDVRVAGSHRALVVRMTAIDDDRHAAASGRIVAAAASIRRSASVRDAIGC